MTQVEGLDEIGASVENLDLKDNEIVEGQGAPGAERNAEPGLAAVPDPVEPDAEAEIAKVEIIGQDGERHDVTEAFKAAANGELFDPGTYVDVPVIDGQATDALVISFGGSVKYEASDRAGQKLFNDLRLGRPVTMRVEGVVADKKGGYKVNAKDEETVTGTARIKIESLYLPSPDEL